MFNDNTLELHGLVGNNAKPQDTIKRFSIYAELETITSYRDAIKDAGAVNDKYIMFVSSSTLYKLSIDKNNSDSIGTITTVKTLSMQTFVDIQATPTGFGLCYWKNYDDCIFEVYNQNGSYINSQTIKLPYNNYKGCGIIGDAITKNTTFISEWNSGNQNIVTLNQNGGLVSNNTLRDYYSCPKVTDNGIAHDGIIYAPDVYSSTIIAYKVSDNAKLRNVSMGTATTKCFIDPKFDCIYSSEDGKLFKVSDFTLNTNFQSAKFYVEYINLYNTTHSPIAGNSQIWFASNGSGYEVRFANTPNNTPHDKAVDIRFLSEIKKYSSSTSIAYSFSSSTANI